MKLTLMQELHPVARTTAPCHLVNTSPVADLIFVQNSIYWLGAIYLSVVNLNTFFRKRLEYIARIIWDLLLDLVFTNLIISESGLGP